jgi:hypothetical protein
MLILTQHHGRSLGPVTTYELCVLLLEIPISRYDETDTVYPRIGRIVDEESVA